MVNIDSISHTMPRIVMIAGPTAVGKSSVAVEIAKKINGEIISVDSMQIYKGMDIGTGKITEQEKQGIKHYLIDIVEPNENFSVSQFVEYANACIDKIVSNNKTPIFVGGTGFYFNAFINGHNFALAEPSDKIRNKYIELCQTKGNAYLHDLLKSVDNSSAEKISVNDTKRIIRALEIYEQTGVPKSLKAEFLKRDLNYKLFILNTDRSALYNKINNRVDDMFNSGLIDEVKRLSLYKNSQSMQAIGYKEIFNMLETNALLSDTINLVKQNSRHYAKRQLTYFRWMNAEKIWLENNYVENILNQL